MFLFLCLVFNLDSWHRAPKFLGIFWVIGAFFVLMRWLLVCSWIDQTDYKLGTFQPHPCLRDRQRLEFELIVNHHLCLHDEVSKKSLNYIGFREFPV